ncbi:MAG: cupin domain-containing protein [Pseudomonadota bacterium]
MNIVRGKLFQPDRAWDAVHVASMNGVTVRLHWTDQPYHWHLNDGAEVFVVLDGLVDMHYRVDGVENMATLAAGDLFFADAGCAHLARPHGAARVLVIEQDRGA